MGVTILTQMWKDTRHVWIIACMCLLHPTLASFSTWPRIIGVAAPYHRVGQYVTFKFQYTQRCCTRVQQLIYGYNCVLIHGLHCGFKDQLTPRDITPIRKKLHWLPVKQRIRCAVLTFLLDGDRRHITKTPTPRKMNNSTIMFRCKQ